MDKKLKVLVVDNEPNFVNLARSSLENSSYRVVAASDREGGIGIARKESPVLIIVGALKPQGEAFRLYRELRNWRGTQNIPLLVVDVRPEEHWQKGWTRDEGTQMDAEDYISRPIEPVELVRSVERILERATWRRRRDSSAVLDRMEEVLIRMDKLKALLVK